MINEAGYVFAPYIPLQMSPLTPETFDNMKKGIQTRYGKKKINPSYYGEITLEPERFTIKNYLHKTQADLMIQDLTKNMEQWNDLQS